MARSRLDRPAILEAAVALADRDGLDRVTWTAVATAVGIKPPSLYNHFAGLESLLDALAGHGLALLARHSREAATGLSGRDAFVAFMRVHRAFAHRHPGLYRATLRPVSSFGPETAAAADENLALITAVLRGYDLDGESALHTVRCLRAALRGFLDLEMQGGFGLPLSADKSFDRLTDILESGLRAAAPAP